MTEASSFETTVGPLTIPAPTVTEAWSAVMGEVTSLGKDSRNAQQGFNFRGIDAVMNLVGPVLRKHGVSILPSTKEVQRRTYTTSKGTVMQESVADVQYTIYGPNGDWFFGSAYGEASDAGDKSLSKAMSVAYRTFLLQALCLPTDEPDPDSETNDRGTGNPKTVDVERTRNGLLEATDPEAVRRVQTWAEGKGILSEPTTDAEGNSIPLNRLFETTLERLGDTTATEAAEKVLEESLGATKIEETPAEPVTEGAST